MEQESYIKKIDHLAAENRNLQAELAKMEKTIKLQQFPYGLIEKADSSISLTEMFAYLLESLLKMELFSGGGILLANSITGNFILSVNRGLDPECEAALSVVDYPAISVDQISGGAVFSGKLQELLPELSGRDSGSFLVAAAPVSVRGGVDALFLLFLGEGCSWGEAESGMLKGVSIVARNAMYRGRSVEEIRQALHEKEMLLREVHHRVKNSLSMILGFIRLSQDEPEFLSCRHLLEHLGNKVESIALVYQHLHDGQVFATVDLSYYLNKLIPQIIDSMTIRDRFTLEYDIAEAEVDADSGIWFGLIITELITNTVRHGYGNEQKGRIQISFSRVRNRYLLDYQDFGVGVPEDFKHRSETSLGLQLMQGLTERMGGTMEVSPGTGHFSFFFPVDE